MPQGLFDRDVERRLRLLEAVATLPILDALYVAVPTAWTPVTFAGAWVNYGSPFATCAYRKVGDVVQLRGLCKSGTGLIFTLPAGFRPPAWVEFTVVANAAFGYCYIDDAGAVTLGTGSNAAFCLDGITFSVTP